LQAIEITSPEIFFALFVPFCGYINLSWWVSPVWSGLIHEINAGI
jgi:hypothetical protein